MPVGWGGVLPHPLPRGERPGGRPEAVLRCGFALPRKGRANPPSVASGGDDRREEASFRLRKHGLLLAEQTAKSAWNTVVTTGFLSPLRSGGAV